MSCRWVGGGVVALACLAEAGEALAAGLFSWDGKHAIDRIQVTVVYFVPRDRTPLPDWRQRVDYFCGRITRFTNGRHFPGAASGGARATYLADRGVGWGLVSADGWRVPYSGTDCVVYHEGVGHAIGLPHPEPGNGSVMSLGQYRGWISESWLDDDQKKKLGWTPSEKPLDRHRDLFSTFRALPEPATPRPDQEVALRFDWPEGLAGERLQRIRVRVQTDLHGPWMDVAAPLGGTLPATMPLGRFDRPTPVSYRVDMELTGEKRVELWGYFQVRSRPDEPPLPPRPLPELQPPPAPADEKTE